MTWTNPHIWSPGDVLTAGRMNAINDNLQALKNPPSVHVRVTNHDVSTNSPSFVPVDSTKFDLTLNTTGGDVLIGFQAEIGGHAAYDIAINGSRMTSTVNGLMKALRSTISTSSISFVVFVPASEFNTNNNSYTFRLLWKALSAPDSIKVVSHEVAAHFWAREVS